MPFSSTPLPDGRLSVHATTVAVADRALLITGPSGSGKSGVAAQMIALGADLVTDDLTVLSPGMSDRDGDGSLVKRVIAEMPARGVAAMELRGLGIVPMTVAGPTSLAGVLLLEPMQSRLPKPETVLLCGVQMPLLRHPATADLAAKLILWLKTR